MENDIAHFVCTDYDKIMNKEDVLLENVEACSKISQIVNPYSDGWVCGKIADALK